MKNYRWLNKVGTMFLLSLVLTLPLVAGGGGQSQTDQRTRLRWTMWVSTDTEQQQWQEIANDFGRAHSNAELSIDSTGWVAYWTRLQTQLASRTQADVIAMQSLRAYGFYSLGGFLPLDDFIANDPSFDISDFDPAMIEALSFNGQIYGLPYDSGPAVLYFNKDLFDAAGLTYPDESWDFNDFLSAKKALTGNGNHGIAINDSLDGLVYFLWALGGDYYNGSTGRYDFTQPETARAFQYVSDLFHVHNVARPITEFGNPFFQVEQFIGGTVGMFIEGPWQITTLGAADFRWGIASVPRGPAGRFTPVAGSGFSISSETRNPQVAWEALKSITSTASLTKLAEWGRGLPARQSAIPGFFRGQQSITGINWVADSSDFGRAYLGHNNWQEVQSAVQDEIQALLLDPRINGNDLVRRITNRIRSIASNVQPF